MRTVITVDPIGVKDPLTNAERFVMKVEKHAVDIPGMNRMRPLVLPQFADWATPDAVITRGRQLRDAMRTHPGVAAVLDSINGALPGNTVPLFVKLSVGDAELITWETLCSTNDKFIALDARWPIGRITDSVSADTRPTPLFRLPVRILAVISAFGIDGQIEEWNALRDAAQEAIDAGLPIAVHAIVGDQNIYHTIASEVAAGRPWASVAGVDGTGPQLLAKIRKWQPNIVHFFCHGRADDCAQNLELATAADYADNTVTAGSVVIDGEQLVAFSDELDNPWLLVLNCCQGAHASRDVLSIAHRVVSAAFPAAMAMLEPVDASDAHEFTRAMYDSLLGELAGVKATLAAADSCRFEWASITHHARDSINAMHQSTPTSQREWALPALYVRDVAPMEFRAAAINTSDADLAAHHAALKTTVDWLQSMRDQLSEPRRLDAMTKALTKAGVPRALWPNVDGTFGG